MRSTKAEVFQLKHERSIVDWFSVGFSSVANASLEAPPDHCRTLLVFMTAENVTMALLLKISYAI